MRRKRVVIVGGGISGLTVAYRLQDLGREEGIPPEITLLEASPRFGGVIQTEFRDGFLLEHGADAFLSEKPWAVRLAKRLEIGNQLIETRNGMRRSFILHQGRLKEVPEGFYLLAPNQIRTLFQMPFLSLPGKLRMACELFIPKDADSMDESVGSFVRRRFGEEALHRIAQPMIGGIYTADPDQLSLKATFPVFREMIAAHGSILRAVGHKKKQMAKETDSASGPRYSLFLSFSEGMETLVKTLIAKLSGVSLRSQAPVTKVTYGHNWEIEIGGRETLECEVLCLAIPAYRSAELLQSLATDIAQGLEEIPYGSVATVNLAYKREDISHLLNGFGFVIPQIENRQLIGCTFSSVKFSNRAPEGSVLFRAFVGGTFQTEALRLDDEKLGKTVVEELSQILGIKRPPLFVSVARYPRGMPQYRVGHLERMESLEQRIKSYDGLYLTGNAFRGVGIPDCIHQAESTAEQMAAFLREN